MSTEDIQFLTEEFPKYYKENIRLSDKVLQAYYQAEKILLGYDKKLIRDCKCEYLTFQKNTNKLYEEWLHNR